MTGKVKLTREQAEAIGIWLQQNADDIATLLDIHANRVSSQGRRWVSGRYTVFNELSQADMARALLIGYEIEEEYKLGDWVRYWKTDSVATIGRIVHINHESGLTHFDNCDKPKLIADITRHATPEEIKAEQERRVWAKIGREVGEFKVHDRKIYRDGTTKIVACTRITKNEYESGLITGFYPAESFISFGGGEDA